MVNLYNYSELGIRHGPPLLVGESFGVGLFLPALAFGSLASDNLEPVPVDAELTLLAALPASL
jgi:hypothetical protein